VKQNLRTSQRYDVRLPVDYSLGDAKHSSFTRNLSLGGLFIEADLKVAFGARVQVRFSIPNQKEPIEVGAVVRWTEAGGFGVQFDGLRARDVWSLGKYFETLTPSAS
jgi:hypothetical protein